MLDIREIINSIFYDLIKKAEFKIVESNGNSILYQNKFCFLFVGHLMGETYVHIKREEKGGSNIAIYVGYYNTQVRL